LQLDGFNEICNIVSYFFGLFVKIQIKNETNETTKQIAPKVSSLIQSVRCDNGRDKVSGCTQAFTAI
jgi:hypothetical protein